MSTNLFIDCPQIYGFQLFFLSISSVFRISWLRCELYCDYSYHSRLQNACVVSFDFMRCFMERAWRTGNRLMGFEVHVRRVVWDSLDSDWWPILQLYVFVVSWFTVWFVYCRRIYGFHFRVYDSAENGTREDRNLYE